MLSLSYPQSLSHFQPQIGRDSVSIASSVVQTVFGCAFWHLTGSSPGPDSSQLSHTCLLQPLPFQLVGRLRLDLERSGALRSKPLLWLGVVMVSV